MQGRRGAQSAVGLSPEKIGRTVSVSELPSAHFGYLRFEIRTHLQSPAVRGETSLSPARRRSAKAARKEEVGTEALYKEARSRGENGGGGRRSKRLGFAEER
ncbi:hypothetical protein BT93_J0497 [Corymbia citriodora subsp. variegata]|nr:hypothetical protein BT93_J0497 [Corymbia citriodora subsp. variegata]